MESSVSKFHFEPIVGKLHYIEGNAVKKVFRLYHLLHFLLHGSYFDT